MSSHGRPKSESLSAQREGNPGAANLELRALALLLDYPTEALQQHLGEVAAALAPATVRALQPLLARLERDDLIDLQEAWVETFDRGRRTALNLFEHVHGDSRDRGQAMVDLLSMYGKAGIHYAGDQLPDYLPVFLDYLATLPPAQAAGHLAEVAHILQSIAGALARRDRSYLPILSTLLALAGAEAAAAAERSALDDHGEDDTTFEAIDAAYAEAPVNFLGAQLQTGQMNACRPQSGQPTHTIQIHRRAA